MSNLAKVAGVATLAFGAVAGLLYVVSPRVTDREAALKINRGKLVDAHVETGVKMDALWPHVQYIQLEKFLQKTRVSATEDDDVNIRTKEKARIYGAFEVHWTLENSDENFGNIYTELKADDIEDIEPYIRNYTIPAAIETYKEISTASVNDDLVKIGSTMAQQLQAILNDRGYTYLRIKDVVPSGVGLSDKANADLEAIVSEERKLDLLEMQKQVAEQSVAVTEKQTEVTLKAFEKLRKSGVPENQLVQAYYLQLMRDRDFLGKQFVPGPIPGTGVGAVPTNVPRP